MSVFDIGQDYRAKLVFDHIANFVFEALTAACLPQRRLLFPAAPKRINFIQVGANDGYSTDPIQPFIKSGFWAGLMIEPNPIAFKKLEDVYASAGQLKLLNCAVGRAEGNADFFACRDPHTNLSSFDKATILKHKDWAVSKGLPDPEDCIERISVSVRTLESLCTENKMKQLDVLVIDAEGSDCDVISSLNIKERKPRVIYFEHVHCPTDDTKQLKELLIASGYRLIFDGYNVLAIIPDDVIAKAMLSMFEEIIIDAGHTRAQKIEKFMPTSEATTKTTFVPIEAAAHNLIANTDILRKALDVPVRGPLNEDQILEKLPPSYKELVLARRDELRNYIRLLPNSTVAGKTVYDWECGNGAFSVAFLLEGARSVIATDTWLDLDGLPSEVRSLPGIFFEKVKIEELSDDVGSNGPRIDLVFANTVTEHIQNLPSAFSAIFRLLQSGGFFLTNHDNYYQPVGSHDHGFLFYGDNGAIVAQGVRCWEMELKCEHSKLHRGEIQRKFPWTVMPELEETRDSADCGRCFYFRRSQPWAHLLYQDEFRTYFPNATFSTGRAGSSLNKVTLSQLRQFVIEAGFDICAFERSFIANEPPSILLDEPFCFNSKELQTCTARILAKKPAIER
jgi:FkbM family methyltransferase